MPVVLPVAPTTSPGLAAVYDVVYDASGLPVAGQEVRLQFAYELGISLGAMTPKTLRTITDSQGQWLLWVTPIDQILPGSGAYIVSDPRGRSYKIKPVTPGVAAPTDSDAFLVPYGASAGIFVHGQKASVISVSARPIAL